MAALQGHQALGRQGALIGGQRLVGDGEVVAQRHHQEQGRRADLGDVGAGLVADEQLDRAQGDLVLPGGRAAGAGLGEPLVGIGRGQRGRAGGIGRDHRDHRRRLAGIAPPPVVGAHGQDRRHHVRANQATRIAMAADQRHLGDHAADPPVDGTQHQDMAAAVAGAPDADPPGRRLGQGLGERDRVARVLDLLPGVDFLARLAVARAEIAVVVDQGGEAGRGEGLGEAVEIHLLHRREAMGHDDGRPWPLARRPVVPAAQGGAVLGLERDVAAHGEPPWAMTLAGFAPSLSRSARPGQRAACPGRRAP